MANIFHIRCPVRSRFDARVEQIVEISYALESVECESSCLWWSRNFRRPTHREREPLVLLFFTSDRMREREGSPNHNVAFEPIVNASPRKVSPRKVSPRSSTDEPMRNRFGFVGLDQPALHALHTYESAVHSFSCQVSG